MVLLSIKNVFKMYGQLEALRGIDLDVERGETVVVIGRSGAGKTTLLRCVSLLENIDHGSISLNGDTIISASDSNRPEIKVDTDLYHTNVGMVFQHLNIWPHRTVLANLMLAPIVLKKMSRSDARRQAFDILERMDIIDKADQYPHALSGGQLQRVALARSLMMSPEILLLDEITSALDPELVNEILGVIADLTKGGMTMLIITHEMYFASEVADRVVFLDQGEIVEVGIPEMLFMRPNTERLKSYLNNINKRKVRGKNV